MDSPGGPADASQPPQPPTVAKKKTKRTSNDISTIAKFRTVCSTDGLPRLFAMIQRNPIIMYPPQQPTQDERDQLVNAIRATDEIIGDGTNGGAPRVISDDELLGIKSEHDREAEVAKARAIRQQLLTRLADCDARATYHHRQLDSFVQLLYEFNHTQFVKLPMRNTQGLLMRLGREQVAYVTEFEMKERAKRQREEELRTSKRRRDDEVTQALREFADEDIEAQIQLAEERHRQLLGAPADAIADDDDEAFFRHFHTAAATVGGDGVGENASEYVNEDEDEELMAMARDQIAAAEAELGRRYTDLDEAATNQQQQQQRETDTSLFGGTEIAPTEHTLFDATGTLPQRTEAEIEATIKPDTESEQHTLLQ